AERLGTHDAPDLLCLSFSCNDPVGHVWGPDSQEVLDVTLRTDRIIRDLLACLDKRVGKGRYVLALTADHGVCPLPEVARAQGKTAGRVSPDLFGVQAEAFLDGAFGKKGSKERWFDARTEMWLYLNQALLRERGLSSVRVERALADWLKGQYGVLTAYTRTELSAGVPAEDAIGQRVRRCFDAERSGDVS